MKTTPVRAVLAVLGLLGLLALAPGASAPARGDESGTCPACGTSFGYDVPTTSNDGGGVDTDGCRYGIASDGRLFVPELRDVIACANTQCGASFFRAYLDPISRLPRTVVGDLTPVRELGAAATLVPRALAVARAIATSRAYGLERLGVKGDPLAYEGKLWLRAAWAVREAALSEDDVRRLPFVFAPRPGEDWQGSDLSTLDREFQLRLAAGGVSSPLEAALAGVDEAREALGPLQPRDPEAPSKALLFGRAEASIDQVERTLLDLRAGLREKTEASGDMAPAELALALARAAHRDGSPRIRDRWLERATTGREVTAAVREAATHLRWLVDAEAIPLAKARECFLAAAKNATGDAQTQLLVLGADAARRGYDAEGARAILQPIVASASGGAESEAVKRARTILYRMGEGK